MGARSYKKSTHLGEGEDDEDEKEKISFSSSFFDVTTTAPERRWRRRLPESQSGRAVDTWTSQRAAARRRPPSAGAQAGVVGEAEECDTTRVEDAAT